MIKLLPFSGFSLLLDCLFSHLSSISRSVSLGYDSINKHCLKTHIPSRGCTVWRCRCFWTGMEHLLWLLESGLACARGAWGKAHVGSHINIETPQQDLSCLALDNARQRGRFQAERMDRKIMSVKCLQKLSVFFLIIKLHVLRLSRNHTFTCIHTISSVPTDLNFCIGINTDHDR